MNTNTKLEVIKTYTTEELLEIAKRFVSNRIPSEVPTKEVWNKEEGTFTIYQIIYK